MQDTDESLPCADKITFDTEKQARVAAITAKHQRGVNLKPYICQHCGLWHLASNYDQ